MSKSIFDTSDSLQASYEAVTKKTKRKRSEIPASFYKRLMNEGFPSQDTYTRQGVNIGSVIKLEDKNEMENYITQFWRPVSEELTYTSEVYLSCGTMIGDMMAERLHRRGVTYQAANGAKGEPHQEMFVEYPEFGMRGFVDLVVDKDFILDAGATKPKNLLKADREIEYITVEVKQTSADKYKLWQEQSDLPLHYRTQYSLYSRRLQEMGITKTTKGQFLILSRDNPNNLKSIDVESEPDLCERAFKVAEKFWEYIFSCSSPLGGVDKNFVLDSIRGNEERLFSGRTGKGRYGIARDFVLNMLINDN
tara:strand:+ start:4887 stop:5807 length:921 start_codon:yes stop_codon:yes gene_type:complete